MMTTCEKYLATYANPNPHDLKLLTNSESFALLVKRVFGKRNCPVELVELGEKIAESCNRVPHAVVVIAGALRGRTNKHDWERVLKIDWQRDNHEIQAHHISS
ncbi:hypothetical protein HAX54_050262 [Datura stramonium]|uniref:NB-ARC domain-containing protein n=1 Tax=Datura stramonium TaxID=4076 RepID=A0ABS8SWQ8_DATST|nr:hypothetical protein [Datura stramonium]